MLRSKTNLKLAENVKTWKDLKMRFIALGLYQIMRKV